MLVYQFKEKFLTALEKALYLGVFGHVFKNTKKRI